MNGRIQDRRGVLAAVVVSLGLLLVAPLAFAQAPDSRVVAPSAAQSETGGRYSDWGAAWWQYVYAIPRQDNPLLDETGAKCQVGQPSGPANVFFLVGALNTSHMATRTCTVPAGKRLFFPLLNIEVDNGGAVAPLPTGSNPQSWRAQGPLRLNAAGLPEAITELHASVDGGQIGDLLSYRTRSPNFPYTFPATSNIIGFPDHNIACTVPTSSTSPTCTDTPPPPPPTPPSPFPWPGLTCTRDTPSTPSMCTNPLAVGDGFYLMLKPLSPGRHTVNFGGTCCGGFTLDITYYLTVN